MHVVMHNTRRWYFHTMETQFDSQLASNYRRVHENVKYLLGGELVHGRVSNWKEADSRTKAWFYRFLSLALSFPLFSPEPHLVSFPRQPQTITTYCEFSRERDVKASWKQFSWPISFVRNDRLESNFSPGNSPPKIVRADVTGRRSMTRNFWPKIFLAELVPFSRHWLTCIYYGTNNPWEIFYIFKTIIRARSGRCNKLLATHGRLELITLNFRIILVFARIKINLIEIWCGLTVQYVHKNIWTSCVLYVSKMCFEISFIVVIYQKKL